MNTYISRGVAFNLSSIGVNFINNYLDTIKGIEKTDEVISNQKQSDFDKAVELAEHVVKYNSDLREDYKKDEWDYIADNIQKELYKLISNKSLLLKDRVI
jgi:hypothetical protein